MNIKTNNQLGVPPPQQWTNIRDNMQVGMMFKDENGKISTQCKIRYTIFKIGKLQKRRVAI